MRALLRWSPEILRCRAELRTRSIELPTRSRPETLIVTTSRSETGTRTILRRTLIHPIPRGRGSTVGTEAVKTRALLWRSPWRAHFVSAAAKILRVFAARRGALVVHHAALMPAHPVGTLRLAGIAVLRIVALLHLRRAHWHSRSPALPVKPRTLLIAATIRLRR